jgi:hypothetical protein
MLYKQQTKISQGQHFEGNAQLQFNSDADCQIVLLLRTPTWDLQQGLQTKQDDTIRAIHSLQTKDGKFTSQPKQANTDHPKFTDEGWQIHKPA